MRGLKPQMEIWIEHIFTGVEVVEPVLPNEEDVIQIAQKWTIDPAMNEIYDSGVGIIAKSKN